MFLLSPRKSLPCNALTIRRPIYVGCRNRINKYVVSNLHAEFPHLTAPACIANWILSGLGEGGRVGNCGVHIKQWGCRESSSLRSKGRRCQKPGDHELSNPGFLGTRNRDPGGVGCLGRREDGSRARPKSPRWRSSPRGQAPGGETPSPGAGVQAQASHAPAGSACTYSLPGSCR